MVSHHLMSECGRTIWHSIIARCRQWVTEEMVKGATVSREVHVVGVIVRQCLVCRCV